MADNNQQIIPPNYSIPTKQKVVFLGDQAVGKTSILNRFIQGTFYESDRPTIGIDFITKSVSIDNKIVKLQLWDTAGQERFKSLIPSYVRDCNIAVIVFDITKTNSFANVKSWYDLVKEQKGSNVIIFLIGNKSDLDQKRQVSLNEAQKMAEQIDGQYLDVSAKTGDNIEELFRQIALQTSNNLLMSYSSQVSVSQSFDHRNVLFIGNKLGQNNQQQNSTANQKILQNNLINNQGEQQNQQQQQQLEGAEQNKIYNYENQAQKKSNIQNFQHSQQQQQQINLQQNPSQHAQKLDVNKHQNTNKKSGGGCC